jgi:hypothetical protein
LTARRVTEDLKIPTSAYVESAVGSGVDESMENRPGQAWSLRNQFRKE